MDFSELQTETFRRLEESSSSPVYWSAADVKESLNEGYLAISEASEWNEVNDSFTFDGSSLYNELFPNLDSGFLRLLFVKPADPLVFWLRPQSVRMLDHLQDRWEGVTGTPDWWLMRGMWHLGVWPRPVTTLNLQLFYKALPTVLSANADTPGFPAEFHLGLVEYALYDLMIQDREPQRALGHFAEYLTYENGLVRYTQHRVSTARIMVAGGVQA